MSSVELVVKVSVKSDLNSDVKMYELKNITEMFNKRKVINVFANFIIRQFILTEVLQKRSCKN
jgi:hypothetical protein